jgi:hypothetical protein
MLYIILYHHNVFSAHPTEESGSYVSDYSHWLMELT